MRRQFFTNTFKVIAVGVGAFSIFKLNDTPKSESKTTLKKSFFLRPPGVVNEKHFLANCIRCGLCVKACPYNTLELAKIGEFANIGTPNFVAKETPCYLCDNLPCIKACPTNALDKKITKINDVNIGRAIVDKSSCVAFFGIQCDACYRACPFINKAIKLDYKQNERTGKHAMLVPEVDYEYCVGCGICEKVCITKKPAIVILPTDFILGERNDNYVKGWVKNDDIHLKDIDTSKNYNDKKAVDYLNDGEF